MTAEGRVFLMECRKAGEVPDTLRPTLVRMVVYREVEKALLNHDGNGPVKFE